MNETGIAMSVLSVPYAAQHGSAAEAGGIARRINDSIAEIIAQNALRLFPRLAARLSSHVEDRLDHVTTQ